MRPEEKLSRMIQCETVSQTGIDNSHKFIAFQEVLRELFPNVFSTCQLTKFGQAMLLCWKGTGSAEGPLVLMSHQDVVGAEGQWRHAPFSGDIAEGRVWGRGAVDTKGSLMCILEAAEQLIAEGFVPERDIFISSSDGEETGGDGARLASEYMKDRGIRPSLVLDEGGMIKQEPVKGARGRFAMMGTLEKGTCNFRIVAHGQGGHASAPGKGTPLVRLGQFMAGMEKKDPFPNVKVTDFPAGIHSSCPRKQNRTSKSDNTSKKTTSSPFRRSTERLPNRVTTFPRAATGEEKSAGQTETPSDRSRIPSK